MVLIGLIIFCIVGIMAQQLSQESNNTRESSSMLSQSSNHSSSDAFLYVTHMATATNQINWPLAQGPHLTAHHDYLTQPSTGALGRTYVQVTPVEHWRHNLKPSNISHLFAPDHPPRATPRYTMANFYVPHSPQQTFHSTSMCFSSFTPNRILPFVHNLS